jgi:hypothetical protein
MKKMTFAVLLLAACFGHAAQAAKLPDNEELAALVRADQGDRVGEMDWNAINRRDEQRRDKVSAMLAAGQVRTGRDYYNAAMVFQHGDTPDDYALALSLTTIARKLAPDHPAPKWLFAATFDRYLLSRNMPQWYGTQSTIRSDSEAEILQPIDPKAATDEERQKLNVPRLQDKLAEIAENNKKRQAK